MVRHVLVAVNASAHSKLALKVARAHYPQAQRTLLTVVDARAIPLGQGGPLPTAEVEKVALEQLGELAEDGESCVAVTGDPVDALLSATHRLNADVLVIGTHGRGGLNRWLLGSVAEGVVRRASVPVLVVHEASVADVRQETRRTEATSVDQQVNG